MNYRAGSIAVVMLVVATVTTTAMASSSPNSAAATTPVIPRGKWSQDYERLFITFDIPLCGQKTWKPNEVVTFKASDRMEVACCGISDASLANDERGCHLIEFQLREDVIPSTADCSRVERKSQVSCVVTKQQPHYFDRLAFNQEKWSKYIKRDWTSKNQVELDKLDDTRTEDDVEEDEDRGAPGLDFETRRKMKKANIQIYLDYAELKKQFTPEMVSIFWVEYGWCEQCRFALRQFIETASRRPKDAKALWGYVDAREIPAVRRLFNPTCDLRCDMFVVSQGTAPQRIPVDADPNENMNAITRSIRGALGHLHAMTTDEELKQFNDYHFQKAENVTFLLSTGSVRSDAFKVVHDVLLQQPDFETLETGVMIKPGQDAAADTFTLRSKIGEVISVLPLKGITADELNAFIRRGLLPLAPSRHDRDVYLNAVDLGVDVVTIFQHSLAENFEAFLPSTLTDSARLEAKTMLLKHNLKDSNKNTNKKDTQQQQPRGSITQLAEASNSELLADFGINGPMPSLVIAGVRVQDKNYLCPTEGFRAHGNIADGTAALVSSCLADARAGKLPVALRCTDEALCQPGAFAVAHPDYDAVMRFGANQVQKMLIAEEGKDKQSSVLLLMHDSRTQSLWKRDLDALSNIAKLVGPLSPSVVVGTFDTAHGSYDTARFPSSASATFPKFPSYTNSVGQDDTPAGKKKSTHRFIDNAELVLIRSGSDGGRVVERFPGYFRSLEQVKMWLSNAVDMKDETTKASFAAAYEKQQLAINELHKKQAVLTQTWNEVLAEKAVDIGYPLSMTGTVYKFPMTEPTKNKVPERHQFYGSGSTPLIVLFRYKAFDEQGQLLPGSSNGEEDTQVLLTDSSPFCFNLALRNMTVDEMAVVRCDPNMLRGDDGALEVVRGPEIPSVDPRQTVFFEIVMKGFQPQSGDVKKQTSLGGVSSKKKGKKAPSLAEMSEEEADAEEQAAPKKSATSSSSSTPRPSEEKKKEESAPKRAPPPKKQKKEKLKKVKDVEEPAEAEEGLEDKDYDL